SLLRSLAVVAQPVASEPKPKPGGYRPARLSGRTPIFEPAPAHPVGWGSGARVRCLPRAHARTYARGGPPHRIRPELGDLARRAQAEASRSPRPPARAYVRARPRPTPAEQ